MIFLLAMCLMLPLPTIQASATTVGAPSAVNPVIRWDRALLEVIRETRPGPTVASRALAALHTCMYDAWAAYDPVAAGTRFGGGLRRPPEERGPRQKTEAITYAAHMAAVDLFPDHADRFDRMLADQGFSGPVTERETPARTGRLACRAVLDHRHRDGANQLGDETAEGGPYADYSGYQPINDPDHLRDPGRWQPLRVPDGHGGALTQRFLTPHWGRVASFTGLDPALLRSPRGPARPDSPDYQAQADEMLRMSAGLTDEQKAIAEYWADGPGTELPPGHWMLFAQYCSRRDGHALDADVKLFFVLANAMLDAGIVSWDSKRHFDSVRPITAVRYLYGGRQVEAWGGPRQGTRLIDGADWQPYLDTPPFPEYVSGHSTFSAAGARVLTLFTGHPDFGARVTIPARSSLIEPGMTPARDVVLSWPTFQQAADQAGLSRRYGGIHFAAGDHEGRLAGQRVAALVWSRAQDYFTGRALPAPATQGGNS